MATRTSESDVKAALGDVRLTAKHLRDVDVLRAFLRWALEQARYTSDSTPDFSTIVSDADDAGFEASENVRDEAIVAAALLEGLLPIVLAPGSRPNAIFWPTYCGTAEDHARHAELLYSGVEGAHEPLIPLLMGDGSWEEGIRERKDVIARLVTRKDG